MNIIDHTDELAKLSNLQKERYSSIHHRYGDQSLLIVKTKKIRGRNSFQNIINNSNTVNSSTNPDRGYFTGLSESLELNHPIANHDLIKAVCAQRAEFNQPQFTNDILEQCLDEVAKVYYFEQGTFTENTNIIIGIKPLVLLLVS